MLNYYENKKCKIYKKEFYMFMSERIIPVKQFPIKVYPYSQYEHDHVGKIISLVFASNFKFPLLPNFSRIDFELHKSHFESEDWKGGSLIKTWDQAIKLFCHHNEIRRPLWIKVTDIEIDRIVPGHNTAPRVLQPKLWYKINIGSFTFMEFKNSTFVKNLCST